MWSGISTARQWVSGSVLEPSPASEDENQEQDNYPNVRSQKQPPSCSPTAWGLPPAGLSEPG